jgi:hypothetical protein
MSPIIELQRQSVEHIQAFLRLQEKRGWFPADKDRSSLIDEHIADMTGCSGDQDHGYHLGIGKPAGRKNGCRTDLPSRSGVD